MRWIVSVRSALASVGKFVLGGVILVVMFALPWLLISGAAAAAEILLPWLMVISIFLAAVCVLVLLPLAIIPATRDAASIGLLIASYVFGLTGWLLGLILTWTLWGWIAVVFGIMMAGVGVVPIAILATLLNGMWPELGVLVLAVVLTFGARMGAFTIVERA